MRRNSRKYRKDLDIKIDLDLTSMMNLVMVLIPCLLISIAFLKLTKIEVMLASVGPHRVESDESQPLNLSLQITSDGYLLKARQPLDVNGFSALQREDGSLHIPVVEKTVSCAHYIGTWPPPRRLNRFVSECEDPTTSRLFRIYDQKRLTEVLYALKQVHPSEYNLTITANQSVEFEALTNAMDASHSGRINNTNTGPLFTNIALEPCDL